MSPGNYPPHKTNDDKILTMASRRGSSKTDVRAEITTLFTEVHDHSYRCLERVVADEHGTDDPDERVHRFMTCLYYYCHLNPLCLGDAMDLHFHTTRPSDEESYEKRAKPYEMLINSEIGFKDTLFSRLIMEQPTSIGPYARVDCSTHIIQAGFTYMRCANAVMYLTDVVKIIDTKKDKDAIALLLSKEVSMLHKQFSASTATKSRWLTEKRLVRLEEAVMACGRFLDGRTLPHDYCDEHLYEDEDEDDDEDVLKDVRKPAARATSEKTADDDKDDDAGGVFDNDDDDDDVTLTPPRAKRRKKTHSDHYLECPNAEKGCPVFANLPNSDYAKFNYRTRTDGKQVVDHSQKQPSRSTFFRESWFKMIQTHLNICTYGSRRPEFFGVRKDIGKTVCPCAHCKGHNSTREQLVQRFDAWRQTFEGVASMPPNDTLPQP